MITNNIILRTTHDKYLYITADEYYILNADLDEIARFKFLTKMTQFLPVIFKNRVYLFHETGVATIKHPEDGIIEYIYSPKDLKDLTDYTIFQEHIYIAGSFGVMIFNDNKLSETTLKVDETFLYSDDDGIFYQKRRFGLFACFEGFRIKKALPNKERSLGCVLDSCRCCCRLKNNRLLLINGKDFIRSRIVDLNNGKICKSKYRSFFNNGFFYQDNFYELERSFDRKWNLLKSPAPEFIDTPIITLNGEEGLN